ncbi:MAG: CHASE3 domain-containing protein, partial [Gemmatimonadaceae bacterium]
MDHSYAVMQALDRLLISLGDTETGQRGFILTGDSAFLEPHIEGVVQARDVISQLRVLVASNDAQRRSLEQLVKAANDRVAQAQSAVATMVTQGQVAATRVVLAGEGQRHMESVRALVANMKDHENRLLEQRRVGAERSLIQAGLVSALGIVTAAALAVIAILLMRRTLVALEQGRRSAMYARTLIDSASDGIYGLDAQGRVTFA